MNAPWPSLHSEESFCSWENDLPADISGKAYLLTANLSGDLTAFHRLVYHQFLSSKKPQQVVLGAAIEAFCSCLLNWWPVEQRTSILKAYLSGNFNVSHDFSCLRMEWRSLLEMGDALRDGWKKIRHRLVPWDACKGRQRGMLDCGKDFGSSFTLYLTAADILHNSYGAYGHYLARLIAVFLFGFDSHVKDRDRLDAYRLKQLEAQKHFVAVIRATRVNPFQYAHIAEIAGNGVAHPDYSPVTQLFASYQNAGVGVKDGKQVSAPVPASPNDDGFIILENFHRHFDAPVEYIWTSNVFSYGAVAGNQRQIERCLAELFAVCMYMLRPQGKMYHLNAYDSILEPKPIVNDEALLEFLGMTPVATDGVAAYSKGKLHAFRKEEAKYSSMGKHLLKEWLDSRYR